MRDHLNQTMNGCTDLDSRSRGPARNCFLRSQIITVGSASILFLTLLLFVDCRTNAQNAAPPDPLITLMQSQPPIITAAPTQGVAVFDPPVIGVGEAATYRVTVDALIDSIEWSAKSPVADGLQLRASARGQTFRSLGGTLQPLSVFNFRARSDQPGAFTIPAFTVLAYGRLVRIPAAQLQVVTTNTQASFILPRLALQIESTNVYVGQSLNVRAEQTTTVPGGLRLLSMLEITGDGMIVDRSLARQRIESRVVNGTNFATLIYEADVIPITAGELVLAAQVFQMENLPDRLMSATNPIAIMSRSPNVVLVDSDPVTVPVRQLPTEGKPPTFDGAIGSFVIDPPKLATNMVRVGEPVNLVVTIRGQGNLSRLSPPKPPQSTGWQIFAAGRDNDPPQFIQARGFATFNYTLIPTTTEVHGTPPMQFSYFDPERAAYTNLLIPSLPLTVNPSPQPIDTQALAKANSPQAGKTNELRLSELSGTRGTIATTMVPLPMRSWFPFLQSALVLAFLALWAWDRRRRFLERHPDILVRRRARRNLRRVRRQLREFFRQDDSAGVARLGVKALQVAASPNFPAEPQALVGADLLSLLAEEDRQGTAGATIRRWFEAADAARFGTTSTMASGLLVAQNDLERVLDRLEEKL